MIGGGVAVAEKDAKYIKLNKYMINMADLQDKQILTVKYVQNRNTLKGVPRQKVSENVADLIIELCTTGKFNKDKFDALSNTDKQITADFVNKCHIDVGYSFTDNSITEWNKQYEILIGQFNTNNHALPIRNRLKSLIVEGIQRKYLPQQQGLLLIDKIFSE
jgi:hypothetical protein